jgi:cytochrome c oxidase subunit II
MKTLRIGLGLLVMFAASAAFGQPAGEPTGLPVIGAPIPGGMNYQPAVTEVAHDTHWLSHWIHSVMVLIVLLVVALVLVAGFRFGRRRNPIPARFTHNTRIEIAWTLLPVLILIVIGSFSLPILFKQLEVPTPDLTIKATGNQWYWSYYYPDNDFTFDSLILPEEELEAYGFSPDLHLLATDTSVVVPVGKVVHMQVTGADVIHAWTIPAFGVKVDAIPGRLNETWFRVEQEGVYFGQCSELCGKNHAYMPITVKAVSQEAYDAWLDWAIDEYGGTRPEEGEAGAEAEAPAAGAAAAAEAPADGDAAEPADGDAAAPAGGDAAAPAEADEAEPVETDAAESAEAPAEAETETPTDAPAAAEEPADEAPTADEPATEDPAAAEPAEEAPAQNCRR